ncbi:MAG: regulatory protein RecX [Rhodanobacter sp.]
MKSRDAPGNHEKPTRSAYDKALGLLARREHSQRELQLKLRKGGYEAGEAAEAIGRLGEQHYQDEERFAQALVRSRVAQGYGPLRLHAELKSHAIPDAVIRACIEAADIDWQGAAAAQLRRRYGGAGTKDLTERAKRAQFLLRRGFAAATVRSVTHAAVDADDLDA